MSIRVHCPTCGADFRVDDRLAGEQGRCPSCLNTVLVPSFDSEPRIPPMLSNEDRDRDRDRYSQRERYDDDDYRRSARHAPTRRDTERDDYSEYSELPTPEIWKKIRSGLGMVMLAAGLYLFGQILSLVFVLVKGTEEGLDKNAQIDSGDLAIAIGSGAMTIIACFFLMFGRKKCLVYPDPYSKVSIYTSFVCTVGTAFSIGFGVIGLFAGILVIQQNGPADPLAGLLLFMALLLIGLGALTTFIQELAWPFYLMGLARGIQTPRAKTWARLNLFGLLAAFGAGFAVFVAVCGYSISVAADHQKKVQAQKQKEVQDGDLRKQEKEKKGLGKLPKNDKADRPKVEGEEPEAPVPAQPEADPKIMMSFQMALLGVLIAYVLLFMSASGVIRGEISKLLLDHEEDNEINRRNDDYYS